MRSVKAMTNNSGDSSHRQDPAVLRIVCILFSLIVVFTNLSSPVELFGRVITVSEILMIVIILLMVPRTRFRLSHGLLFLGLILPTVLSLLITINVFETLKSLLAFLMFSMFVFVLVEFCYSRSHFVERLTNSFLSAVLCLASYAIVQYFTNTFFGPLPAVIYPFGEMTWQVQSGVFSGVRANSLYYEPNIFGMVAVFAFWLALLYRRKWIWYFIVLTGIILTFSTTTYALLLTSFLLQFLLSGRALGRVRSRRIVTSAFLFLLLTVVVFALFAQAFQLIENLPVLSRLREIYVPGTSGYYRVTAPINVARYTILSYPLGTGIGTIRHFLLDPPSDVFHHLWKGGTQYGTTIDNILLGWIITMGILGIPYVILFSGLTLITAFRVSVGLAVSFFGFTLGTGAFLMPEFWILLLIVIGLCSFLENGASQYQLNRSGIVEEKPGAFLARNSTQGLTKL